MLDASPLTNKISIGVYPHPVVYQIGGKVRTKPYWKTNGIHSQEPVFVQNMKNPSTEKEKHFYIIQEARRKESNEHLESYKGSYTL